MDSFVIERVYLPDRTLGSFYWNGVVVAKTLELPWKENRRSVSCIPEGIYDVIKQPPKADRPYPYFRLPKVEGRTGILIHRGTEPAHSKGCILAASRFRNINTSKPSLEESSKKLQWMIDNFPDEFMLVIRAKSVMA
jgi:hypothetical protein